MTDRLGQQLGNYRLTQLLGRGGFAEVYLGEHVRLNTQAALKVLHTSLQEDDVASFLREAQLLARLRHPHIVRVFDFDVENHTPFLVMDYLPNGNVRRLHPKGMPLPLQTLISYVTQVASALQYAHDEKLIHRDIKPENMLLDRDQTLVLSDFGIALMSQSSRFQSLQEVAGTAAYMAPEQFQGHPRRASDQYALGIVVYEWLTGDRPFHGSFSEIASQHLFVAPASLREKVATIPLAVEQMVLRALAKDPEARFASVQAFATALRAASDASAMDSQSARTSGGSDVGTVSSATASVVDRTSPLGQMKEQGIPVVPPPMVGGSLQASAPVPLSDKQMPATASYAQPVAASPVSPGTKLLSAITEPPRGGRTVPPSPLPVAQGKKPLPSMPITPSFLPARIRLPAGRAMVLVLLVLVVVGGGGIWAMLYVTTPSLSSYDQFVMKNGVQFGFNAQHTGFNPYESELSPATVSTLVQAWTASTGGMTESPAVANGMVYINSYRNGLYAFKAEGCGQSMCLPLWTASTGLTLGSSPAVANGVVYIGSNDGKLYAFRADGCSQPTCSPLWTASTDTGDGVLSSSPAVANGMVYVGSRNGKLYAFKANGCGKPTCSHLWTATIGNNASASSPAVANGVVYVDSGDGKLYAFKADGCGQPTCSPLWTSTGGKIYFSPAVANGVVYVGGDGKLHAFKADGCGQPTCSPLWTANIGGQIHSSPAVVNGVVYIGSGNYPSAGGKLYAFKADGCGQPTCSPLWTTSAGIDISYESSPAVANGVVYIGSGNYPSADGKLYAFKADGCGQPTCSPLWTATTGSSTESSPAVANGVVYVGSGDGKLYAFHRR